MVSVAVPSIQDITYATLHPPPGMTQGSGTSQETITLDTSHKPTDTSRPISDRLLTYQIELADRASAIRLILVATSLQF